MDRTPRADLALALAVLVGAAAGCARAPTVVREPSWTGQPPSSGTPSYAETLEVLHFLFEEFRQPLPQRVSTPAPCVLRVVTSDEFSRYPTATVGKVYRSTWVDLSRVTELHAQSSGPESGRGPSPAGTCASFGGARGFALQTEVVARARGTPARHIELADEKSPRICIGQRATPERLAGPLRQLVTLCGGRAAK